MAENHTLAGLRRKRAQIAGIVADQEDASSLRTHVGGLCPSMKIPPNEGYTDQGAG